MEQATPIFVDSVYQFLLATLVLSYAWDIYTLFFNILTGYKCKQRLSYYIVLWNILVYYNMLSNSNNMFYMLYIQLLLLMKTNQDLLKAYKLQKRSGGPKGPGSGNTTQQVIHLK